MKYKGMELCVNSESEDALSISVNVIDKFDDEDAFCDFLDSLEDQLIELVHDDAYVDSVADGVILVRSDDITFDEDGVALLTRLYHTLINAHREHVSVAICVHIESSDGFKRDDGITYNEDEVSLDEFLANIEY